MFYKFIDKSMQFLSGYSNSSLPGRDYNIYVYNTLFTIRQETS